MLVPSRPSQPTRDRIGLAVLLLLSAGLFFTALDWGLPSRDADRYLFGDRTPWTGEQILALAGGWGDRGDLPSDLDADPLDRTAGPVVLNDTDAKRAAIVLRYRLYSYQPDEMQTFRALASMRPGAGDLDPRFYLYGGLWVYPIGGLLKAASLLGWVTLRSDLPYYLDHPEAFGRFYVVARAYSAAWGVAGVYVCYLLGLRLGGSATAGWYAGLLFALLPVTVNAAHEAKPHLAGAVLSLAAILPAGRYVSTGRRRWAVLAGVLCGASAGVVLSGASAFVVVVAMAGLRAWRRSGEGGAEDPGSRGPTGRSAGVPDDANLSSGKGDSTAARWSAATRSFEARAFVDGLIAVGAGALVYALTNPYVVMNLLRGRSVVGENVGHLQTFYWPTLAGVPYALALLVAAAGPAVVVAGAVALMISRLTAKLVGTGAVAPTGLLLAALALTALLPFLLLADGKTADYGRFALVPAACSSIGAAGALGSLRSRSNRGAGLIFLAAATVAFTLPLTAAYLIAFASDRDAPTTRTLTAGLLAVAGRGTLITPLEPAPFSLPPVDLWRWRLVLHDPPFAVETPPTPQPATRPAGTQAIGIRPLDGWSVAPITWANKLFDIQLVEPTRTPPVAPVTTRP